MGDNERQELSERILTLEVLFRKHEEGALERKEQLSKTIQLMSAKLDAQQCAVHTVNMIAMQGRISRIEERVAPELRGRLSVIEKVMWTGFGGLSVLMGLLKWLIK